MKKTFPLILLASLLIMVGCEKTEKDDDPATPTIGLFKLPDGSTVRFAPGNLVYDASTGYGFTAHQFDYGGYFGWGTGSDPTYYSNDWYDYTIFDDWGNHIEGGWRTLSETEWKYLIGDRAGAADKCGTARVCGTNGLILLPDNWEGDPIALSCDNYDKCVLDVDAWSALEADGAIFLPAAGYVSNNSEPHGVGAMGYYWVHDVDGTSSSGTRLTFNSNDVWTIFNYKNEGLSVRLVQAQ